MTRASDIADGLTAAQRAIALAQPADRWRVWQNQARDFAGTVKRGFLPADEFATRFTDMALSHDLEREHDADEIQGELATMLAEATAVPDHINGHRAPPDDHLDQQREQTLPSAIVLPFIDAATLAGHEPAPRRWLVPNRIPLGNVTLLSGDGATGKTTIAMQLAAATVTAGSWLNAVVDHDGPAMFLSAEEDPDELHRRTADIAAHFGIGFDRLAGLHLLGMPGADALLGTADRSGIVRATPLFEALRRRAEQIAPALIVIEAAADVFGGNENDRGQVRQFIGLLRRLAMIASTPAIVLIAHPSLTGLANGSGTSGSTGWSNSVRSRLYFAKAGQQRDDEGADDVRELRVMKSNYGPAGEVVPVRWQRGVFVPVSTPSTLERAASDATGEAAYLACLDGATGQGRDVYPHKGRGYAPSVFADMPQAQGYAIKALAAAQERLLHAGRIHIVPFGPASKGKKRIERKRLDIEERQAAE
jgi:RecA-family ATPase